MNDLAQRLVALKTKAEEAKEDRIHKEGALAQARKQLKKDFKVATSKEGRTLLASLEKQASQLEVKLNKEVTALEAELSKINRNGNHE